MRPPASEAASPNSGLATLRARVGQLVQGAQSCEALAAALREALREVELSLAPGARSCASEVLPSQSEFRILHFNDVYDAEAAPRFVTLVEAQRAASRSAGLGEPLTLFSGDVFNPSVLSVSTRGAHMVPVLNTLKPDAACFGNHDLDFGATSLATLAAGCCFPWVMSNCGFRPSGGGPIAGALRSALLRRPDGLLVGVLGLIEQEWIATLSSVREEDVVFEDYVAAARRESARLREAEGAQVVVALTHMRWRNDERLARECAGDVDLVLAGHDHDYEVRVVNGVHVVKSGSDFRDLSVLSCSFDASRPRGQRLAVRGVQRCSADASAPEDAALKAAVGVFLERDRASTSSVLVHSAVDLEARFSKVRREETNTANLVADIMRLATRAEVALLNAGSLRADRVIPRGPVTLGDLRSLLPMVDSLTVLEVTGRQLLLALENGVSRCDESEGRWPCLSGLSMAYDPRLPAGQRVLPDSVSVAGAPLEPDRHYSLATKAYVAEGRDGYDVFRHVRVLADEEQCQNLPTIVRNHFIALGTLNAFRGSGAANGESAASAGEHEHSAALSTAVFKFHVMAGHVPSHAFALKPTVEGRIVDVSKREPRPTPAPAPAPCPAASK